MKRHVSRTKKEIDDRVLIPDLFFTLKGVLKLSNAKMLSVRDMKIIAAGANGIRILDLITRNANQKSESVEIDESLGEKIRGTDLLFTLSDSCPDMKLANDVAEISKSVDVTTFGVIVIGDDLPKAKYRDEKLFEKLQSTCDTFLIHTIDESLEFFNEIL